MPAENSSFSVTSITLAWMDTWRAGPVLHRVEIQPDLVEAIRIVADLQQRGLAVQIELAVGDSSVGMPAARSVNRSPASVPVTCAELPLSALDAP